MNKTQIRTPGPAAPKTTKPDFSGRCPGSGKPWHRPSDALPSCPGCHQLSDELRKAGVAVFDRSGNKLSPRVPVHPALAEVTAAEAARNLAAIVPPATDARSAADAAVLGGLVRDPAPAPKTARKAPSRTAKAPAPASGTGSTPRAPKTAPATTAPSKASVAKAPKTAANGKAPARKTANGKSSVPAPAPAANGGSARRANHRELARRLAEAARDLFDGTDPEGEQRVATWLKFLPTGRREDGKRWWPEGFALPETDAFGWDPSDRDGR